MGFFFFSRLNEDNNLYFENKVPLLEEISQNELDLNNLNNLLLKTGLLRSVLNIEYIETCLKSKINIYSKHMDNETGLIILKCKRLT